MKVEKQITYLTTINIDITEITLLSIEEYLSAKDNIPPVDGWWWLRSPSYFGDSAACVGPDGGTDNYGLNVITAYVGVRPALRINPKSADLQIGEKIRLGGFIWTYVSEGALLCDSIITHMPFRNSWRAINANDYEKSYIKKFVESWFAAVETTTQP